MTLLGLFALAPPAWAPPTTPSPDLYTLQGTVRDPLGRGVGGVIVLVTHQSCNPLTDPDQCVQKQTLTAADGTWSVGEKSPGDYLVEASRTGSTSASGVRTLVAPGTYTLDLEVSFLVAGALDPSAYLSTASAGANATLTITSWAPHSGTGTAGDSCVWVTDSRAGSTLQATYAGNGTGSSHLFTYPLALAQGTTEGTYSLSYHAQDCGGPTHLSTTSVSPYVVDNRPPVIWFLTPLDRGNVAFAAAPLAAKVMDAGPADVDATEVRFTLIDETDPARPSASYQGAGVVSWDQASGWAKTPSVSFTGGHVYRLEVRAKDRAGNTATTSQAPVSEGGGFLAMSGTGSGHVLISTLCSVGPVKTNGRRDVTCPNVTPVYSDATVTFSGVHAYGVGHVRESFSWATARLADPLVGEVQVEAFPSGVTPPVVPPYESEFRVPASGCPAGASCTAPGGAQPLGTVLTEVLATWASDTAWLKLDSGAVVAMDACADPTAASLVCVPDPVRFFPVIGTPLDGYDPRGIHNASVLPDGDVRFPLEGDAPPSLFEYRNLACSGGGPTPAPEVEPAPFFDGIRPGGWMVTCDSSSNRVFGACTLNFVFRREDDPSQLAIGTSGHCLDSTDPEDPDSIVWAYYRNPDTGEMQATRIGRAIVKDHNPQDLTPGSLPASIGRDFGLIKIDSQLIGHVRTTTATIGGPCGEQSASLLASQVSHVGHGYVANHYYWGNEERQGTVLLEVQTTDVLGRVNAVFGFAGRVSAGDSGSPVQNTSSRFAAGVLSTGIGLHRRSLGVGGQLDDVDVRVVIVPVAWPAVRDVIARLAPGWVLATSDATC